MIAVERIGVLLGLPALACGVITTQVGAELPPDAGPGGVTTIDAAETGTGDVTISDAADAGRGDVTMTDAADAGRGDVTMTDAADAGTGDVTMTDATPACLGDLSNIGAKDFRVSFEITTMQTAFAAVANQRGVCAYGDFWDIRMNGSGFFAVETDDGVNYTPLTSAGPRANDGRPHDVVVQRTAGTLMVLVDGALTGSAPSKASLGALPPLRTGSDVCTAAIDGTMTFVGTISNLCLASP